jgi:hypothetical protein
LALLVFFLGTAIPTILPMPAPACSGAKPSPQTTHEYHRLVGNIEALYRELDPIRPLAADEDALYVDWQSALDPGAPDVKSRLVRSFTRNASPDTRSPAC